MVSTPPWKRVRWMMEGSLETFVNLPTATIRENSEMLDDVRAMRCPLIKSRARHFSLLGIPPTRPYRPSRDHGATSDVCTISETESEAACAGNDSEDQEDTEVFLPNLPNPRL
uniref:Uncharacterized protein n=1 Tax=Schistocephalus solidus TaxID=70667 RepID=A0A0X3PHM1_SCHSO